jgi:hypothetical protein
MHAKAALKVLLLFLGASVLLTVSCLGYIAFLSEEASESVEAFCNSVAVGQPILGLTERGRRAGLNVAESRTSEEPEEPPKGTLLFAKGVMLAQHTCDVEHSRGYVTSVKRGFVD